MKLHFNLGTDGRKKLVAAVSTVLDMKAKYLGAPGFCYQIGACIVDRTGVLDVPVEIDAEDLAMRLSNMGFERKTDKTRFAITIPTDNFDEHALTNLINLIDAKASLIQKALDADSIAVASEGNAVVFDWFSKAPTSDEAIAYTQFCAALIKLAKEQHRVTAKPTEVENEKYAFRCFLLRLGFIGKEKAATRKILLSRLSGNAAFKYSTPC